MNMAMVTSFIIGGILLLSIVSLNISIGNSGAELTINKITRDKLDYVTAMLDDDIQNMGFDLEQPTDTILTIADSNQIQFYRNLCRDPERDAKFMNCDEPERITWQFFEGWNPPNSRNNNHGTLMRVVEAVGAVPDTVYIRSGVAKFNIRYYDTHGASLGNSMTVPVSSSLINSVRQLYIELEMQSNERIPGRTDNERYIRSVSEKRFSPRNLEVTP